MNIAGLNNLFAPQGPAAKAGASSPKDSKESPAFEDVLGQATSGRQQPPAGDKVEAKQKDTAGQSGLDSALPGQGIPPALSGPSLQDRVVQPAPMPITKAMTKAAVLSQPDEGVDNLTRRVVWNDFLRKMKEELGISAEDVLQAFGGLSDEELAQPPSQTVDKIVMALGLNDSQALLAKQYFNELIQKTQTRSLGEELQNSSNQISLTLMSERELQRKAMDRNLASMNQNFFMNNMKPQMAPMPAAMRQPAPMQPNSVRIEDEAGQDTATAEGFSGLAALTPDFGASALPNAAAPSVAAAPASVAPEAPVFPSASLHTQANAKALDEMTAQMQPVSSKDQSVDQLVQKFMSAQAPSAFAQAQQQQAALAAASAASAAPAMSAAPAAAVQSAPSLSASTMNSLLAALDADDAGGEEEQGESLDASFLNAPLMDGGSKLNGPLQSGNDFQTQLSHLQPGAPMEVPDLVQTAQVMVREGGGEMKVTMSPEGLGEVAMRVSVDQGKVNVQMITESDEAKKLIERQLNELKGSLQSNHLQVADIKVDTATNMGKQMEQQYQDAQRQMAQAQWEQFRQDNQGWRRSQFEVPSVRAYKGQSQAMRDVEAPSGGVDARGRASRRLDLVA